MPATTDAAAVGGRAREVLEGPRPRSRPRLFRWRRSRTRLRRALVSNSGLHLLGLALLALAIAAGALARPTWVPVTSFGVVLVVGGFVLRPRAVVLLIVVIACAVAYVDVTRRYVGSQVDVGVAVLLLLTAGLAWLIARSRARLGLHGTVGDTMLVDLRDRLRAQGELPALPEGWHAERVVRSAYGQSFSGDFVVATRVGAGQRLEVVLVDVSGKGAAAGTRALLLSGAFGGLLGAMPAASFLAAANAYLLRQHWDEGFATAVHLDLDLDTGDYRVAGAGHPPAAQFHAGSGKWSLLRQGGGPVLGVLDAVRFDGVAGRVQPGDALLLYTDGVVETPDRDLDTGIDRMLGHAERLVRDGFEGGARRIVEQARAGESDDRALVLVWRS